MKKLLLYLLAGLFLLSGHARGSVRDGAPDYREMTRTLKQLVKNHPDFVSLESIGTSGEGRDIWLVRISNSAGNPAEKPALLVCSNITADYLVGSRAIVSLMDRLLAGAKTDQTIVAMLQKNSLYFIPRLNPDGAEHLIHGNADSFTSDCTPFDDDHDGLIDEDGPEDLDNNGIITFMRVKRWDATHLPLAKDDRLLKKADPQQGETAVYRLYSEGIDNDGDGSINEDGIGGTCIDRNFPHAYPYYQQGAGPYMTSEPETRAVIDFLSRHKNVTAVLAYAPFDNIIQPPEAERKRPGDAPATGARRFMRVRSVPKALNAADLPVYKKISDMYKDLVYNRPAMQAAPLKPAGSLTQWAYYQYGVVSISSPFWHLPAGAPATKEEEKKNKKEAGSQEALMQWIDAERIADGFVPWKPYTHPDLGEVEIGGFNPLIAWNPPQLADTLIDHQLRFIIGLSELFPVLTLKEFSATREADQVFRITAVIENDGFFPTVLAHGAVTRNITPTRATLAGKEFTLLEGQLHQFLPPLNGSGGAKKVQWLIHAQTGTPLVLTVVSEKAGTIRHSFTLRAQE